jgi:TonB family protein
VLLLGVVAITRGEAERVPRARTSLTYAPVSLAAPVATLPTPREPARLAVRKIEPLPKAQAPVPAEDARRIVEPPEPVQPTPAAATAAADVVELPPAVIPTVQKPPELAVRLGAFEAVNASRPRARETAAVMAAGFGDASPRGAVRALPTAAIAAAGFDRETAPPPPVVTTVAPAAAFGDSSIEILFKPKPRYTDEAEALGIQGTVVLEVEFTAANDVRVLRVVRTLGHGLDESAIHAAEQIRFKPARRQGVAIDSRVTVQIEFRLS